jgi:hypothetical protein
MGLILMQASSVALLEEDLMDGEVLSLLTVTKARVYGCQVNP